MTRQEESKLTEQLVAIAVEVAELRAENKILKSVSDRLLQALPIHSVSGCYTRNDMIIAYDAGAWNPNDQKAEQWLNQAYNCR